MPTEWQIRGHPERRPANERAAHRTRLPIVIDLLESHLAAVFETHHTRDSGAVRHVHMNVPDATRTDHRHRGHNALPDVVLKVNERLTALLVGVSGDSHRPERGNNGAARTPHVGAIDKVRFGRNATGARKRDEGLGRQLIGAGVAHVPILPGSRSIYGGLAAPH